MKVEITDNEKVEIGKAFIIAAESAKYTQVDWQIISEFLVKLDISGVT